MKINSKKAFTLAELILALTIVGIVALQTIPTMVQNVSNASFKAAFKKEYAAMSQAHKLAYQNGLIPVSSGRALLQIMTYYNYSKSCGGASDQGCWHKAGMYKDLDGTFGGTQYSEGYILTDGSYILFASVSAASSDAINTTLSRLETYLIDVNGAKSPNTIGRDIFAIKAYGSKILPMGAPNTMFTECNPSKSLDGSITNGYGCAAKVLLNQDY